MSSSADRLLRLPTVLHMVGLGKTTVYEMMKNDDFPKPRRVRNASLWVESEVQTWIRRVIDPDHTINH
ncbi:AlpA family phage regulatory protein [Burkholderia stagnalis]|uniref:helix-turn-helix transcriptional regulator n=1 Tax=Burkholderia stagnalis TaxID=1503054 RepID=UPI0009C0DE94